MPGIPGPVERTAIETLITTYGKTWHTWQVDRNAALPLGIPQLMMGFTQDGQIKAEHCKIGIVAFKSRPAMSGKRVQSSPRRPRPFSRGQTGGQVGSRPSSC